MNALSKGARILENMHPTVRRALAIRTRDKRSEFNLCKGFLILAVSGAEANI